MLDTLGTAVAASGDFAAASALIAEADAMHEVTGAHTARVTAMMLAVLRGRPAEAARLIETAIAEAEAGGPGIAVAYTHWAAAILHNGLGRYEEALTAARQASEEITALPIAMRALPELIEAAARAGQAGLACDALTQLAEITQACGNDSALGIEARCRALLSHDADDLYREAIDRLGRTGSAPSWPARTCCTGSGCAARAGEVTRANSCARPATCSPRSAWRRSPSAPARS